MGEGKDFATEISDIFFSDISCNKVSETAIVLQGYAQKKIRNVQFDTIDIQSAKNGMTITNAEKVQLNEVVIGKKALIPTAIK